METPAPLQPAEELLLQQYSQVQFWHRKHPAAKTGASDGDAAVSAAVALPAEWDLTRGIALHDWQTECVDRWFASDHRGVIKVVTGAGKTILALAIAERLQRRVNPDLRLAIVVPTVVLLDQWHEELVTRGNLPPSAITRLGGGENIAIHAGTRVVIAVLNSAARKLPELIENAGWGASVLLIVDECHRAGATEWQQVFRTPREYSLGLSATPERDVDPSEEDDVPAAGSREQKRESIEFTDSVLGQALGPVVYELNYADAIRLGVLPPFNILHYGLSLKPAENVQYEKVSREIKNLRSELERPGRRGLGLIRWCRSAGAAGNPSASRLISLTAERKRILFRMEERGHAVQRILRDAFAANPDTKAILFHESIEEVMRLFAILRAEGLAVVAEHSEFPEAMRAASLRLFKQGTARVIISAKSLIEGFNVPSADLGIIVAATSSVRQRVQTLGRLLRKSPAAIGAEQKHAVLHVLYATKTVDELIYEKADWEQFVGADRNQYHLWPDVLAAAPVAVAKAPRSPALDESAVDEADLRPRDTYPGDIEQGLAFSRDSQGTIRTDEGNFILPHAELASVLKGSLKTAGRFRVTPARRFVLELEKVADGWRGVYLGQLNSPVQVAEQPEEIEASHQWTPGEVYPLTRATGKTFSVLQRDPRLIATKGKGGEVRFVPPLPAEADPGKRATLGRIQTFLRAAYTKGHRISKLLVTNDGHVVYVWQNQAYFVDHAPEGAAGFVFETSPVGI